MDPAAAHGENLGIVKFGPNSAPRLVEILDRIVGSGRLREWAPRAFTEFAQERPLYALGTRGYPWIEIDFPEDYQRALRDVLPAIDAAVTPATVRRVS
jgi:choline kinase